MTQPSEVTTQAAVEKSRRINLFALVLALVVIVLYVVNSKRNGEPLGLRILAPVALICIILSSLAKPRNATLYRALVWLGLILSVVALIAVIRGP
jgi:hypothetical protein